MKRRTKNQQFYIIRVRINLEKKEKNIPLLMHMYYFYCKIRINDLIMMLRIQFQDQGSILILKQIHGIRKHLIYYFLRFEIFNRKKFLIKKRKKTTKNFHFLNILISDLVCWCKEYGNYLDISLMVNFLRLVCVDLDYLKSY